MRLHITPVLYFDHHEREVIVEAMRPYRVLTGEDNLSGHPNAHAVRHKKSLGRVSGEMRQEWLLELHRLLLDLREALHEDAHKWDQTEAPEESTGLIAKPRQVVQMLSEVRFHQTSMCEQALAIVREAMGVLKPVKLDCEQMAQTIMKRHQATV